MNLRILFVEDSADDAELMRRRLRAAGIEPQWERVQSEDALRTALAGEPWDLALVDYNLPGFGGLEALAVLAEAAPDLPAITVSGAISEETAVATITAGAVDYVLKDNLTRLAPAVRRAVEGAALRRQHRRASEQAAASEALCRRIVELAGEGIWAMDGEQRTTFVNPQMATMLGYESEEMLGHMFSEFLFDEDLDDHVAQMEARAAGQPGHYQRRFRRKDGGEVWTATSATAVLGPEGEYLGSFGMFTDITRTRAAEEETRRMALVVDAAPNSITVHDFDGRFLYANQKTFDLHGYSRDEFLALELRQLDVPAAAGLVAVRMQELREHGEASFEAEHFRKDGTILPVEVRAKVTMWGGKEAILSVATDLTERKQAEEDLAQLNAQHEGILRSAAEGILGLDLQGNQTFVNPAAANMLGYAAEELVGLPSHSTWHHTRADGSPYPREECRIYAALRDGAEHRSSSEVFWRKDGSSFPVEYASTPICEQGRSAGAVVTFTDITDRKRAEEELRLQEMQLRTILESTGDGILAIDNAGEVIKANQRFADLWQIPADLLRKGNDEALLTYVLDQLVDADAFLERVHALYASTAVDSDTLLFKDGRMVERYSCPLLSEGVINGRVWSFRDVTTRKRAEEEIRRQAEQLKHTVEGVVLAMSHVVESRDPYTAGHERRVAELAGAIAAHMGLDFEALEALRLAALIHDIGKIAVPAEILSKPGRLSEVEFTLIKQHPASGFEILGVIDFGLPVAEIVRQHHERLDGSGYPRALSGKEILPEARILAVADVVEAMSSHRPYRAALGMEAALAEVREHSGVKYDAEVVTACVRLVEEQSFAFTL